MAAVIQRPLRGSRVSTFYPVKNLPSLASLDSAFQLQEYISLLIRLDVHDVDAIISFPGTSQKDKEKEPASEGVTEEPKDTDAKEGEKDAEKAKAEVTVDEGCWIYEQLRRLAQDLSHPLITTLQQECTRASCPEMKAGEWLYLCVAHGNDGAMEQCCAIDYILHTVDSATALLNSPRTFPSRLSIPQTSHRHFASLARRLGRIFAHAYYHHREAFEQAEAESSLYARFLALTAKFDLVPSEFLVIPSNRFSNEDAGPSREREPSHYEYNDHGRGNYHNTYQQQQRPEIGEMFQNAQKYRQQEYHGLESGPRHPSGTPGLGESSGSSGIANGGIGENPSTTRSRFGRNRTDTMVFSDSEASAIADELAAKARAGQLEPELEAEAPRSGTGSHEIELEKAPEEDEEEADLEGETQFEISLSPEEEINGTFADFSDLPTHLSKVQGPVSLLEREVDQPPVNAGEATQVVNPIVDEPVVPVEEEKEQPEEKTPAEPVHVEGPQVTGAAAQIPVPVLESSIAAPKEIPATDHEVKEVPAASETGSLLVTLVPPVMDATPAVKAGAEFEPAISSETETPAPPSPEVSQSVAEDGPAPAEPPSEHAVPAAAELETAVEAKDLGVDASPPEPASELGGNPFDDITPEEIDALEEAFVVTEIETPEAEEGAEKTSADTVESEESTKAKPELPDAVASIIDDAAVDASAVDASTTSTADPHPAP